MKKKVKITEATLNKIVKTAAQRILKEGFGMDSNSSYDKLSEWASSVDTETIITELCNYMSSDELEDFIQFLIKEGQIPEQEEEDYDY